MNKGNILIPTVTFFLACLIPIFTHPEEPKTFIEEEFLTDLGETMHCRITSDHPAITVSTLHLWRNLRNPYGTYQFPPLIEFRNFKIGRFSKRETRKIIHVQKKILNNLRTQRIPEEIKPLHKAVIDMFEREHRYSMVFQQFLEDNNPSFLVKRMEKISPLTPDEKNKIFNLIKGKGEEDPRTLEAVFLNTYVMIDENGKHFSDYSRDFMKQYGVHLNCFCISNC